MATYFHGGAAATHQILNADGLQKLLLMNTAYSVEDDSATTTLFGCPAVDPASVFQPLPPLRRGLSLSLAPGQQRQICSAYLPESPERYGGTTQSLQRAVMGSRYLRATQQLLEEVVGVGGVVEEASARMPGRLGKGVGEDDACGKPAAELAAGERQELQMRKAKLVHLLDEVETRYKQYEDRMQAVAGSFEAVVGPGSARTYTALALRTISRRFRCLKDAICSQIRTAGRSLGEEECLQVGGARPQLLSDHLVRQQRALQQLGMMQHSAWRPQRGLPERSVSVLRAWLFEHFLHPYPKDSDKHLLAKQTGLTRNQVSNWFINARVRLWKPMVEEMYMEEMKNRSAMNGDDDETGSPADGEEQHSPSKSTAPQPTFGTSTETEQSNCSSSKQNSPPAIAHYDDMLQMMQPSAKKPRSMALPMEIMDMKPQDGTHVDPFMGFAESHHGYGAPNLFAPSSYPIDDVAGFSVDGVSLSLGLQRSSAQPVYLSDGYSIARRFEMAPDGGDYRNLGIGGSAALPQSAYESLEVQSRKGFAAQLLQDFVA